MLSYGFAKAVPLQMPFPGLFTLVEPFGNFSPMGVLWSSVGASQHYEIAAGCLELLGGLLLFIPRTTTLGALISLADMTYVFLLNMTYDVPVKLLSLQLVLMSLFLLAPHFRRFAQFLLPRSRRRARPQTAALPHPAHQSHRSRRARSLRNLAHRNNAWGARIGWKPTAPALRKPALYGIWDVEQFSTDGQPPPAAPHR